MCRGGGWETRRQAGCQNLCMEEMRVSSHPTLTCLCSLCHSNYVSNGEVAWANPLPRIQPPVLKEGYAWRKNSRGNSSSLKLRAVTGLTQMNWKRLRPSVEVLAECIFHQNRWSEDEKRQRAWRNRKEQRNSFSRSFYLQNGIYK